MYSYYDSPITVVTQALDHEIIDDCMKITKKYMIDIDEKKLIAALKADNERYRAAYKKGYETCQREYQHKIQKLMDDVKEESE